MDKDTIPTTDAMQAWAASNVKDYRQALRQASFDQKMDWSVDNLKPMIVPGWFANEALNVEDIKSKYAHTQQWVPAQWTLLAEQPLLRQVMQQALFNTKWAVDACETTIGLTILNGDDATPYQEVKTVL